MHFTSSAHTSGKRITYTQLRCLKENIVPRSIKINYKQFRPLRERKIICKTQILNSRVRHCNSVIDQITKDIEMLRSTIKNTTNSTDFDSITNLIFNSKDKLYKKVKQ